MNGGKNPLSESPYSKNGKQALAGLPRGCSHPCHCSLSFPLAPKRIPKYGSARRSLTHLPVGGRGAHHWPLMARLVPDQTRSVVLGPAVSFCVRFSVPVQRSRPCRKHLFCQGVICPGCVIKHHFTPTEKCVCVWGGGLRVSVCALASSYFI